MSNLHPGTFNARCTSVQFGIVEKSGNDYIRLGFEIGFDDGSSESISTDLFFTQEKNTKRSIESLRYCGWNGVDLSQLEIGVEGMGDTEVDLVLDTERYKDSEGVEKDQLRVKWINRHGAASVALPMTDHQKSTFAARMKGLLLADSRRNGTPKPAPAPAQNRTTNGAAHRSAPVQAAPESQFEDLPPDPGCDSIPF